MEDRPEFPGSPDLAENTRACRLRGTFETDSGPGQSRPTGMLGYSGVGCGKLTGDLGLEVIQQLLNVAAQQSLLLHIDDTLLHVSPLGLGGGVELSGANDVDPGAHGGVGAAQASPPAVVAGRKPSIRTHSE